MWRRATSAAKAPNLRSQGWRATFFDSARQCMSVLTEDRTDSSQNVWRARELHSAWDCTPGVVQSFRCSCGPNTPEPAPTDTDVRCTQAQTLCQASNVNAETYMPKPIILYPLMSQVSDLLALSFSFSSFRHHHPPEEQTDPYDSC